jgi:hypothetical protein
MTVPSGCPSRVVRRGYGDYFFVGGEEGLEPVQTLVPFAANSGSEPNATNLCDAANVRIH